MSFAAFAGQKYLNLETFKKNGDGVKTRVWFAPAPSASLDSSAAKIYAYIFAALESRLADGAGANHTRVFTPSPFFLNVSRFKYFCPANAAKLIASLLPTTQCTTVVRCVPFYMCYKHKRPFRPNRSTLCSGLPRFHLAFLSACITPKRFPSVSVR